MKLLLIAATVASLSSAGAAIFAVNAVSADERLPIIRDQTVKKECGACHMAFQPQFLPASSWHKIMNGLPEHFGEDASLDEETARHITDYLVKYAGRSRGNAGITITKLNWFVREHNEEVSPAAKKKAGTMANCVACHKGADQGLYDDD